MREVCYAQISSVSAKGVWKRFYNVVCYSLILMGMKRDDYYHT